MCELNAKRRVMRMTANLTTKTMKMRRKRLLLLPKAARSKASRGACLSEPMVVT